MAASDPAVITGLVPVLSREGRRMARTSPAMTILIRDRAVASVRRLVAGLGAVMGYLAGWGFILCAAFITFDVIARRFFGFSSQSTTEITGYALAFGISWALAHTLTARAHVRIDVLINHLPAALRYPMHS